MFSSVATLTDELRAGRISAVDLLEQSLATVERFDPGINAFTDITAQRARREAQMVDEQDLANTRGYPLAGIPYGVKNLFDLSGVTTRAGARINRDHPPAIHDAFAVASLSRAGGVCVGALNMGEYAYDFTGENAHDGNCRNPHDVAHMAGGSSSGPAAAVAAGMVPFALGTDTNGSIRVPSSYCGLFGLKPTFGRLSRSGVFPFVSSLDHIGPIARTAEDIATVYDALQGRDWRDPAQIDRALEPVWISHNEGIGGARVAVAGGYFQKRSSDFANEAVAAVAGALSASDEVILPEAERARAAAFLITAAESAGLHLPRLRTRAADFDPMMRDRLLAGTMIPGPWVTHAQRFRRWYQRECAALFESVDLIITPATPTVAPAFGQPVVTLDGVDVPVRQAIGLYTQPISFAGLPAITVPYWGAGNRLPIGVQLIAAPWREALLVRAACLLERAGVCVARQPDITNLLPKE
ncbi:MAG: AtzE family amidohydrolase [Burkholderiaceae bacterium]